MKVGFIRCKQMEDQCSGTADFRIVREKARAFEGVEEDIEIIGFATCGGCPGKKAVFKARKMVERGADTIAFTTCVKYGAPIGYPCPNADKMIEAVRKDLGENIKILERTH